MKHISIIWDELRQRFEEADNISIEDVNLDTRKYLTLFLDAGYDATMIAQMLDRLDVLKFYPVLKDHGVAMVNFMELFSDAPDFVKENFDTFANYGVPVDDIVKTIVADRKVIDEEELEFYIEKGATPRYVLELLAKSRDWFDYDHIYEVLLCLVKHGCDKSTTTSWFMSNHAGTNRNIVYNIIEASSRKWSEVLYLEQYVDRWIEYYGKEYITGKYLLRDLPKLVDYNKVVDHFTMSEIIIMNGDYGLDEFVEDYREVGGDPKNLVARFMKEIGEPKNDLQKDALRAMEEQSIIVIPNPND